MYSPVLSYYGKNDHKIDDSLASQLSNIVTWLSAFHSNRQIKHLE